MPTTRLREPRSPADSAGKLVPAAERAGVRLGLEALHPMFCADRCVVSRLGDALDLALLFPAHAVGIIIDTYHVWWDSQLAERVARARGRIAGFQLADWVLPLPADSLLGRGHLGDGDIDLAWITAQVLEAGYGGYAEVEILRQEGSAR